MPAYRKKSGKKGWYIKFMYQGKQIKKENNPFTKDAMLSKVEALQLEREYIAFLDKESKKRAGAITLYELYDEFVSNAKGSIKISTTRRYDIFKRLYLDLISNKSIWDYHPNDFNEWRLRVIEGKTSDEFKTRTISIMKQVLSYGNEVYNIPGNLKISLMQKFKNNEVVENKIKLNKWIKEDGFKELLNGLDLTLEGGEYYYTLLTVLYYTGLRIGELAALTINDFKDGIIYVNKNYIRVNGVDYIQAPKTNNSIRKISLDPITDELLRNYISKYKPKDIIFKNKGKYITQQRVNSTLKKLSLGTSLEGKYELHAHILRHSHASNLRDKGWNEYQIAARLGNTPEVSASTYIHSEMPSVENIR